VQQIVMQQISVYGTPVQHTIAQSSLAPGNDNQLSSLECYLENDQTKFTTELVSTKKWRFDFFAIEATLKSPVPKNETPATAKEVGDVPTNLASSSANRR
jgi:hypothetical protein